MGPLYYCIFTNDFPEVVHSSECSCKAEFGFSPECCQCGSTVVYADDSTFSISDRDPTTLSNKLSDRFKIMADYLTSNKLKVNEDKTHLLVMCTDQRRRKLSSEVTIQAQNHVVRASETELLLGIYIQSNMK